MRCKACDVLLHDLDKGDLCYVCSIEEVKARFPDQKKVQDNEVQDFMEHIEGVMRINKEHENFSS
tara:strand:- start:2291 stop:2485 length:195 start_codon:yes stop_codon:yes gene_type:complete